MLRGIKNSLKLETVKWVDKAVTSVQAHFQSSNSEWQKSTGAINVCECLRQALSEGFILAGGDS